MTMGLITIMMTEQGLRIVTQPDSDLLNVEHRIFLSNVLGLQPSEEFAGYVSRGPEALQILKDVIDYLRTQKVTFRVDQSAQSYVSRIYEEKEELEFSRVEGRRLKLRPSHSVNVPDLQRPLKDYQVPSVAHMVAVGNEANFSVPGSGKTAITLAAFKILKQLNKIETIVVIGPRSSFMAWEDEYEACFGKEPRSVRIVGTPPRRKRLYRVADDRELVLLTYQMANNDANELTSFLRRHESMLVLDESHNIKRIEGGKWADTLLQMAPYAARRVVLTGTPIPNSLLDIWSQITFLWPNKDVLGEREPFRRTIEVVGRDSPHELREALYPLYWRIRKSDLNLPRPRYHRINVPMSRYQQTVYDTIATKVLAELVKAPEDRVKLRVWRRARMIRLLQAASNPTLLTRYSTEFKIPPLDASGLSVDKIIEKYSDFETPRKIEVTIDLVREIYQKGEKVIVWTAFIHNIRTLERLLGDLSPAIIYGDVPKDEEEDAYNNREQIIRDFKQTNRYKVLIANPSACAESYSLQKACYHAIYLDRTFNAAHYMQSQDRIHRIGLGPKDIVHYYLIQSRGSIDEVIDDRLEEKITAMEEVLAEDFEILNLDSPEEEFSEESEFEKDFNAVLENLRKKYGGGSD